MNRIEPQASEVHEATDDASTSPASSAEQHTRSPDDTKSGPVWRDDNPREPSRTNVSAIPPVESDDAVDAPPGHLELREDLSTKTFYPTEAEQKRQA